MRIWGKRLNKITVVNLQKIPPMSAEKLLEIFAVDPETPWLLAVLAVLAGIEEMTKERIMIGEMEDSLRAFYSGGIRHIAEAQEEIIKLVEKGNEAKLNGRKLR